MRQTFRTIRRSRPIQKSVYNALNRILTRQEEVETLNCGIIPRQGFQVPLHRASSPLARLGLELYHQVGTQVRRPLAGLDILEIGCGRGGGTAYLAETFAPHRIVGIDFSSEAIRFCRSRYPQTNLEFLQADALKLPNQMANFDLALSIETLHMMDAKPDFFREVHRTLKRHGHFLYLDFVYTRDDSPHSIERVEAAMVDSGFSIQGRIDWTSQVLASLDTASPSRESLIEETCPRLFRKFAHEFCMTQQSNAYHAFKEGRTRYFYYTLRNNGST